jgi:tryptophan-rich hypothetical protein
MNQINPAKLQLSKWTAVAPRDLEKHFLVTGLLRDDQGKITGCVLEAVHSRRQYPLDWRELRDPERWLTGWR